MTTRRQRAAGFTLIEALASIAALAAILAGLSVMAGQWMPHWRRGFEALQNADLVAQSLDRIAADLSAAQPVRLEAGEGPLLFRGDARSVVFVREAIGPGAGPRLEYVRIGAAETQQGLETQRARAPFLPGEIAPFRDAATLLRAPFRLSLAYQAPDGRWTPSWAPAKSLPRAIQLTVTRGSAQIAQTAFLMNTPAPPDITPPHPADAPAPSTTDAGQR